MGAFGGVNRFCRARIGGVRPQPVNGLSREDHQPPRRMIAAASASTSADFAGSVMEITLVCKKLSPLFQSFILAAVSAAIRASINSPMFPFRIESRL